MIRCSSARGADGSSSPIRPKAIAMSGSAWGTTRALRISAVARPSSDTHSGIRHVEAWFVSKGGKVPDESTLKRRLRNIWTKFGPEGAQNEP